MNTPNQPDYSILIPCFNEQDVIGQTVVLLIDELNKYGFRYEILCVNNASTDNTEQVLISLSQRYSCCRYVNTPKIPGYGVAVRWGLEHYRGQSVVIIMADGSESPNDVARFFKKIDDGYECAFGSRFTGTAVVEGYPRIKLIINRLGNKLIAWLVGSSYNDFTNGFKCYSRATIDGIKPLYSEKFNLTIEMSINTVILKPKIAILENSWRDRSEGISKFNLLGQSTLYLKTLAYCYFRWKIQGRTWQEFKSHLLEK
jgi:dolichol-phosphate mannosyltransferase